MSIAGYPPAELEYEQVRQAVGRAGAEILRVQQVLVALRLKQERRLLELARQEHHLVASRKKGGAA
jgi:hypothetical protein